MRSFHGEAAATAETFASAIRDREHFRGCGDEAAVAWLYGIARKLEERSYDDVAAVLQISQPAARARVSRGLRSLAVALDGVPLAGGGALR